MREKINEREGDRERKIFSNWTDIFDVNSPLFFSNKNLINVKHSSQISFTFSLIRCKCLPAGAHWSWGFHPEQIELICILYTKALFTHFFFFCNQTDDDDYEQHEDRYTQKGRHLEGIEIYNQQKLFPAHHFTSLFGGLKLYVSDFF